MVDDFLARFPVSQKAVTVHNSLSASPEVKRHIVTLARKTFLIIADYCIGVEPFRKTRSGPAISIDLIDKRKSQQHRLCVRLFLVILGGSDQRKNDDKAMPGIHPSQTAPCLR
jgi:hypothetical protein